MSAYSHEVICVCVCWTIYVLMMVNLIDWLPTLSKTFLAHFVDLYVHLHTHFFHWATFFCTYFVCLSSPLFVLILLLFCLFGICCCSVIDSRSELSPRFPRIVFSILSSFLNHSTSFFRPANCVCSQLTLMCGFC